jgi:hypothetical protein
MSWAHLSPEQAEQAEQIFQTLKQATERDLREIAGLLASQPDHKLLGRNEYDIRQRVHKIGAKALETAVNLRKKGGTEGPVSVAPTVPEPPGSSPTANVP